LHAAWAPVKQGLEQLLRDQAHLCLFAAR